MIKRYDELRIRYAQLHMTSCNQRRFGAQPGHDMMNYAFVMRNYIYNTYRRVGAKPHPNKMKS